jgi:alkaline phosphatase
LWKPEALANASHSAEYLASQLNAHIRNNPTDKKLKVYISEKLVKEGLGIVDASDEEIQYLADAPLLSVYTFADMVSRRAQIGWSTHGHSAVDVNIYGTRGSEILRGNHENIEVGEFLRNYLDVNVHAITEELVEKSKIGFSSTEQENWMGRQPTKKEVETASNHYEKLYGSV